MATAIPTEMVDNISALLIILPTNMRKTHPLDCILPASNMAFYFTYS